MKRLAVLLFALIAIPAFAQSAAHKASGVVVRTDQAASKVTIKHGPVPDLKWPGMTMTFVAQDKALLQKLKPGQKIDFEFVQEGRDYVVTSVK